VVLGVQYPLSIVCLGTTSDKLSDHPVLGTFSFPYNSTVNTKVAQRRDLQAACDIHIHHTSTAQSPSWNAANFTFNSRFERNVDGLVLLCFHWHVTRTLDGIQFASIIFLHTGSYQVAFALDYTTKFSNQ
jgi:hypothetical protein